MQTSLSFRTRALFWLLPLSLALTACPPPIHKTDGGLQKDGGSNLDGGLAFCGNGKVDPGEQCDDGNNVNGDGCEADCTPEVVSETCAGVTAPTGAAGTCTVTAGDATKLFTATVLTPGHVYVKKVSSER